MNIGLRIAMSQIFIEFVSSESSTASWDPDCKTSGAKQSADHRANYDRTLVVELNRREHTRS